MDGIGTPTAYTHYITSTCISEGWMDGIGTPTPTILPLLLSLEDGWMELVPLQPLYYLYLYL